MSVTSRKEQVVELLKSLETGQAPDLGYINPDKYIQHNLGAKDGLQGLRDFLAQIPPNTIKVNTVRLFQDGDYVNAHTDYDFFGLTAGFDVFRYENDQIVEHWDNLQQKPAAPNPSGHTMTDGSTEAKDLESTEQNKQLVRRFLEDIFIGGNMDKLADYYNGERYIQHNPQIADGLSGLRQALQSLAEQGTTVKFDKIHYVLGEGNFVLAMSEGEFNSKPAAFYDLFRIENGKIAEHWDTTEIIPPKSEWQNQNGKF